MSDVDQAAPPAPTASRSEAQQMLDRHLQLFNRMLKVHRRLVRVRSAITPGPAPSAAQERPKPAEPKAMPFFAGLTLCAGANEAAVAAIEADVADLAKLFDVTDDGEA